MSEPMTGAELVAAYTLAHTNTITALGEKGVTATDHGFSDFPADIRAISTGGGGGIPSDLPSDGKTRICYKIPDDAQTFGKTITLSVYLETAETAISVDWGDDSEATTASGLGRQTLTHAYSAAGEYIVTVTIASGTIYFGGGSGNTIYGSSSTGFRSYVQWAVLGTGVSQLGSYAFTNCTQLTEVRLPSSGLTTVGSDAFEYCTSLTSVNLPNTITTLGMTCFSRCYALPKLTLPNTITTLNQKLFSDCQSLIEVNIPATVTTIASQCFMSCASLQKLRFNSTNPPTVDNSNAFSSLPTTCIISVPTGYLSAYTGASSYPSSSTYTYIEED